MRSVALTLLLIAVASCVQLQSYKRLQAHQSAGNLFAQIQAMIEAGGPLANIEGLVDELETQIHDEQREHSEMLARNQASCIVEHDFRKGEIKEAESALERAENHLAACEQSLLKTIVDIGRTSEDIASTTASLATARALRAAEYANYLGVIDDHNHMLSILDGAMDILDDFVVEDASLIQLSKQTAIMAKQSFKIQQTAQMAPVIAMFAQMATSEFDLFLDEASIARIQALIQACIDSCQESLDEYHALEAAAVENFELLEAQLVKSLAELEATLVMLTDHQDLMKQCILEENVVIVKASDKIERNSNLLQISIEMCDAFEAEYEAATAGRDEELELLVVVRGMIKKRFGGLGDSIYERDDEFDNTAVSSYEHSEYESDGGNRDHALEGYGF